MTLSLAIAGAAGRMGQALIRAATAAPDLRIAGGSERPDSAALGKAIGGGVISSDVATAAAEAAVWIDFTAPAATLAALAALPAGCAAIVGTTGFSEAQEGAIAAAAKTRAIVRSGNFSLGVNLLAGFVRQAAARLGPEWDIEILETHHRRKVDAPSGTALLFGEAAAAGRGHALSEWRLAPYDGVTGPRPEGGIGFSVRRGGGVVGQHEVMFAAEREIVRLSHDALDRAVFADGALAAARWVAGKPTGLYAMSDVLGL